jgi:hypothetical protein
MAKRGRAMLASLRVERKEPYTTGEDFVVTLLVTDADMENEVGWLEERNRLELVFFMHEAKAKMLFQVVVASRGASG